MSALALSMLVFLLLGGFASVWVLRVRQPRDRCAIGLRALSGMHWREFQRLMVEAFRQRGCEPVPGGESGDREGVVLLRYEGRERMLAARHGAGYVPGLGAIGEFANTLRLHGASGGWMTSMGSPSQDTLSQARLHGIELLDGGGVWAAVEPVLDPALREEIAGAARRRALRGLALAWALAAAAGAAAFMLAGRSRPEMPPPATVAPPAVRTAPAAPSPTTQPPRPGATTASPPPANDGAGSADEPRRQLATAVAALPWVERAFWSTRSTLVVHLATDGEIDREALCALVESQADLRASRLQLQPPQGSERPVRFFQCRAF